jgi:hypothetical protein
MPLQATSGAASYDAFGGGVPVVPAYIEDVFSNYLWTGNSSSQTITNGIDLSAKGGMVWIKARSSAIENVLLDTTRGIGNYLVSNNTDAQIFVGNILTSVLSNGFDIGSSARANSSGVTYASWTFRKQPKFFDVVTFSGTGSVQNISHNLGSVPACIIIKDITLGGSAWAIYHRSLGNTQFIQFSTSAAGTSSGYWNNTTPTSTQFTVGTNSNVNNSSATYVAYIFAHDAGGFGLTGTDNVISCAGFTTDSTGGATVTLGYEPQWILAKQTDSAANWYLFDVMRGMNVTTNASLNPNRSDAETSFGWAVKPTATGFEVNPGRITSAAGQTFIYIAIRRGPMKVPTSGTSVYSVFADGASTNPKTFSAGFPTDFAISQVRSTGAGSYNYAGSRLTGNSQYLVPQTTGSEQADATPIWTFDLQNSFKQNISAASMVSWLFRRAPSFFDEVCYTGNGSARTVSHNLGVAPEMMIVKRRDSATAGSWFVYASFIGNGGYLALNDTTAVDYWINIWNDTTPTSTQFTVGSYLSQSGGTHVAYLFATCAGVSKVGSYTGTGTTLQIDCGFTGGARFVLIKRTDSTGAWYVWDSARGIVSGNDPYLLLNSTAAEVTNTDYIDTYSAGFEISSTAPAAINASGGTFIFLAIA